MKNELRAVVECELYFLAFGDAHSSYSRSDQAANGVTRAFVWVAVATRSRGDHRLTFRLDDDAGKIELDAVWPELHRGEPASDNVGSRSPLHRNKSEPWRFRRGRNVFDVRVDRSGLSADDPDRHSRFETLAAPPPVKLFPDPADHEPEPESRNAGEAHRQRQRTARNTTGLARNFRDRAARPAPATRTVRSRGIR